MRITFLIAGALTIFAGIVAAVEWHELLQKNIWGLLIASTGSGLMLIGMGELIFRLDLLVDEAIRNRSPKSRQRQRQPQPLRELPEEPSPKRKRVALDDSDATKFLQNLD